jgi:calcineurin-like phosphoesterase
VVLNLDQCRNVLTGTEIHLESNDFEILCVGEWFKLTNDVLSCGKDNKIVGKERNKKIGGRQDMMSFYYSVRRFEI